MGADDRLRFLQPATAMELPDAHGRPAGMKFSMLLAIALLLSACQAGGPAGGPLSPGSPPAAEASHSGLALVGSMWTVETVVAAEEEWRVPAAVNAYIAMHEDGTVQLDMGCNTGSGRFVADALAIRFSDVEQTLIGCDGDAARTETAMREILAAAATTYTLEADRLTLTAGDRRVILRRT